MYFQQIFEIPPKNFTKWISNKSLKFTKNLTKWISNKSLKFPKMNLIFEIPKNEFNWI